MRCCWGWASVRCCWGCVPPLIAIISCGPRRRWICGSVVIPVLRCPIPPLLQLATLWRVAPPPPTHTLTHTPCAADLAQLCTKTLMALLAGGKQQ